MTEPIERQKCQVHRGWGAHGGAAPVRTVYLELAPTQYGVWTCDNGFHSINRIMNWLHEQDLNQLHTGHTLNRVLALRPPRPYSQRELGIAREGYRRWVVAGRPRAGQSQ
jgi:hypothetical protein